MATDIFNVASASGLRGPVDQIWKRFKAEGFAGHYLPDDDGWMPTEPFSGQVVGRVAIRDELGRLVVAETDRGSPYTNQQKRNLLREGAVLDHCNWPVMSVPAIPQPQLEEIAHELATSKPRRNKIALTDTSHGSNI